MNEQMKMKREIELRLRLVHGLCILALGSLCEGLLTLAGYALFFRPDLNIEDRAIGMVFIPLLWLLVGVALYKVGQDYIHTQKIVSKEFK